MYMSYPLQDIIPSRRRYSRHQIVRQGFLMYPTNRKSGAFKNPAVGGIEAIASGR